MDLILLVLILACIGFVVYLITTKIPMDPLFKILIYVLVAIVMILWFMRRFSGNIPNVM